MANQESTQYASAYTSSPKGKLDPKELNGRVRRIFAEVIFSSELAVGESVKMAKLPANATIIQAEMSISASATAGSFDLGWSAGNEGLEASSLDGIMANFDPTSTAIDSMDKSAAGADAAFNKKFSEPVDVQIINKTAPTSSADGETLRLELLYIID